VTVGSRREKREELKAESSRLKGTRKKKQGSRKAERQKRGITKARKGKGSRCQVLEEQG
jgi:hypothetical protein